MYAVLAKTTKYNIANLVEKSPADIIKNTGGVVVLVYEDLIEEGLGKLLDFVLTNAGDARRYLLFKGPILPAVAPQLARWAITINNLYVIPNVKVSEITDIVDFDKQVLASGLKPLSQENKSIEALSVPWNRRSSIVETMIEQVHAAHSYGEEEEEEFVVPTNAEEEEEGTNAENWDVGAVPAEGQSSEGEEELIFTAEDFTPVIDVHREETAEDTASSQESFSIDEPVNEETVAEASAVIPEMEDPTQFTMEHPAEEPMVLPDMEDGVIPSEEFIASVTADVASSDGSEQEDITSSHVSAVASKLVSEFGKLHEAPEASDLLAYIEHIEDSIASLNTMAMAINRYERRAQYQESHKASQRLSEIRSLSSQEIEEKDSELQLLKQTTNRMEITLEEKAGVISRLNDLLSARETELTRVQEDLVDAKFNAEQLTKMMDTMKNTQVVSGQGSTGTMFTPMLIPEALSSRFIIIKQLSPVAFLHTLLLQYASFKTELDNVKTKVIILEPPMLEIDEKRALSIPTVTSDTQAGFLLGQEPVVRLVHMSATIAERIKEVATGYGKVVVLDNSHKEEHMFRGVNATKLYATNSSKLMDSFSIYPENVISNGVSGSFILRSIEGITGGTTDRIKRKLYIPTINAFEEHLKLLEI